jgi:hypothetical protein
VTRKLVMSFVLALGLLMICGTTFAHHGSGAAYDYNYRITTTATVTDFVWSNPHGQLYFDLKNDKGETQNWGIELNSPGNLIKLGWTKNTFKPGDVVTISFVPSKGDRPFGICGDIVRADGQKFHNGQCGSPDLSKLQVKPGYTAVEVKMPQDLKTPQAQ